MSRVSSPGLTVRAMSEKVLAYIACAQGLTEMRMGFRSGLAKRRQLDDEMTGMHLSSVGEDEMGSERSERQ